MIFKRFFSIVLLIVLSAILCCCAQIVPLTGGKKDRTPPVLLMADPPNKSTNISPHNVTITFRFDEMIDAKLAKTAVTVNPLTDNLPDVTAYGKKLIVQFDDDLNPNTTYQIQFGNSVADIHEGNKYKNLTYIFSTGPTIDSNIISGNVISAINLKPLKGVSIFLYDNLNDSVVTRGKPTYAVTTDSVGMYSISAIKPNTYQIVAVGDKNKNKLYDVGESIGFLNNDVFITNDTVDFAMSEPESDKVFIKKKMRPFYGYHQFILNDTVPDAYILCEDDALNKENFLYETRNDTLELYYKDTYDKTLTFFFKRNETTFDTINIEVGKKPLIDSLLVKGTKKINVHTTKKIYGATNDDVFLDFSFPLKDVNTDKCIFMRDSIPEKLLFTSENKNENKNLITTYLPAYKKRVLNTLVQNTNYTLTFLPGSITTFWNTTNNDTLKTTFKTYASDDIGTLQTKLVLPDSVHYFILQLLNSTGKVVTAYSSANKKENTITFYNLSAADYSLRLIDDEDANKKFTPANFFKHTQPEAIYQYNKALKIPAGWDVEANWNFISPEKK